MTQKEGTQGRKKMNIRRYENGIDLKVDGKKSSYNAGVATVKYNALVGVLYEFHICVAQAYRNAHTHSVLYKKCHQCATHGGISLGP